MTLFHGRYFALIGLSVLVASCDTPPDGMTEVDYAKYKQLGAPKLIYSCTAKATGSECHKIFPSLPAKKGDPHWLPECITKTIKEPIFIVKEVNYGYGEGLGNYNKLLSKARETCREHWEFEVLESAKL
jgi:hypothetical protein